MTISDAWNRLTSVLSPLSCPRCYTLRGVPARESLPEPGDLVSCGWCGAELVVEKGLDGRIRLSVADPGELA
ncbi:MAG: hypothetical protein JXA90_03200 [Planctomycetes bacterium]|nr:hypothetical protein [Planctomycetota bacterium]